MDCSRPGLPVPHQLPELTQTHVHRVSDAIQPSYPLSSLLLPPSIFPSIRVFSNESTLHIRWPKYWSFSFSISPSNEYSGLISFRMCFSLQEYQSECLSHIIVPDWSLPSKIFDIHLLLATKAAVRFLGAFTNTSFGGLWENSLE